MNLPPPKDYQTRAVQRIQEARQNKGRPVMAVAPPGSGKSRCMLMLSTDEVESGGTVLLKVHRKMLLDQLVRNLKDINADFGVISPDYPPNYDAKIQIASAQTLFARAVKSSKIELPKATLIINDEAHQQASKMERALIFGSVQDNMIQEGYASQGIDVVGFSATPIMESRIYDQIIDIVSYSELRRQNMHQLVHVYGPDEIDTAGLKAGANGEFSEKALAHRVPVIFASVYNEWRKLNPNAYPAILFAPSVPASRWFAEEYMKKGVKVAHLDGQNCLLPEGGKLVQYQSTREMREEILRQSQTGEIDCIMNRFVLREAIDMPWLYHGIFATVMGSLTTFLQSVGRLQRFWAAYDHKILQCHGGSYWRHGSPNEDREWRLGLTAAICRRERVQRVLDGQAAEGIRCPNCGFWRKSGDECFSCKHRHKYSVRAVRQLNGTLKEMRGRIYKIPKSSTVDGLWTKVLFQTGRKGLPVSSAVGMYSNLCAQKGYPVNLPNLTNRPPSPESAAWHLPVSKVYPWTVRKRSTR